MSVGIPVHEHAFTSWTERANYFTQLRDKIATLPRRDVNRHFNQRHAPQQRLESAL